MRFWLIMLLLSAAWAKPPRLNVPKSQAPELAQLGEPAVRGIALSPDRTRLVRWSSAEVFTNKWRRGVSQVPAFVRFSVDGRQVGVLLREPDADYRLLALDATTGAVQHDFSFVLRTPSIERGIQPPARPTALVAVAGGFRIVNAYGSHLVDKKGSHTVPGPSGAVFGAQDGAGLWVSRGPKLVRLGSKLEVPLPCNPQQVALDLSLDRAVVECSARNQPSEVHLVQLSTGKVLRTHSSVGRVASIALHDADRFTAFHASPGTEVSYGKDVAAKAHAGGWHEIQFREAGHVALGVGVVGEVQVFDLNASKVLCDHARLGFAALSGGFGQGDTLWFLVYRPGVFNALDLVEASLATCTETKRTPLQLGKTTNYLPKWVPGVRTFVLNALVGSSHGLVALPVNNPQPQWLAQKRTPRFQVSEDGERVGWVDHQGCGGRDLKSGKDIAVPKCDFMALPAGGVLSYGYKRGWSQGTQALFDTVQPIRVHALDGVLYVATRNQLHRVLLDKKQIAGVWQFAGRAPHFTRMAPSRRLLMGGGPTGWQVLSPDKKTGE